MNNMHVKYLHDIEKPLLPAIGDVRIIANLDFSKKNPNGQIRIAHCIDVSEHHAIYEILGEKENAIAIPFEIIQNWGFESIDSAIKWILNTFLQSIIDGSKNNISEYSSSTLSISDSISDYYSKLENLVSLSRQLLKEAEKTKNIYLKFLEKTNKEEK